MYCMANLKVVSLHSCFSMSQTLPSLQLGSLACSSIRDFRVVGSWLLKGFLIGENLHSSSSPSQTKPS